MPESNRLSMRCLRVLTNRLPTQNPLCLGIISETVRYSRFAKGFLVRAKPEGCCAGPIPAGFVSEANERNPSVSAGMHAG